ncbi:thiamin pyrophosphokinase 1-like [Tropilaelaps mercedesae]|uniref:Thiamin pyrophosphokinase 1-like n=1 Tax=Tropilaelaps mercedesae TaxID=418985 RepID=A0A1V9WZR1_9ACAR|nr:thiamin pyrophosphokinase 1-like [Tropilaelaps mercedesae]
MSAMNERRWNYERWVSEQKCAIVILNQPLNGRQCEAISRWWTSVHVRVCADGGSNRLFHELPQLTPDLIVGDLDSVEKDVLLEYQTRGVEVCETQDQNFTDFTKCLQVIAKRLPDIEIVLAFCISSGRLDQIMGNVNTLCNSEKFMRADIVLHAGDEITWILRKGRHRILTPESARGGYCGIIPIGRPVTVTSRGLKWDLNSTQLEFKELISTSNRAIADEIQIETTDDLLWTMTLKH